ncbi:MAG: 4'-phosphopantetheinyl transferase family protein [Terriglobia bacterium]
MTTPVVFPKPPEWQKAPKRATLGAGEVHVWRANLAVDPAALQALRGTLSGDEGARAERFYASADRDYYVAGRGILRALLAQYLETPAEALRFCTNAHGKPALPPSSGSLDLRFNLSHSDGHALFAFALGREVGVDLEYIHRSLPDRDLAERYFSPPEVAALRALPKSEQAEGFFHFWTRKEAYIKARGGGLSISLASFTVSLAPGGLDHLPITGHDDPDASRWTLRGIALGNGFIGAVAAEGADWSLVQWQWA